MQANRQGRPMTFWMTLAGCVASALVTLPVPANAAQSVTVRPTKDGTLADGGTYGAFDGVADNVDWTFNQSSYEGAITLSTPATGPKFEYRVVWEYDLTTVTRTPPVSATLTVSLRGAPIYPRPDAQVQVFSYPADLTETNADFSAGPAQSQGILVVHPFQPATQYTLNVSNAVNEALSSGAKKVAFRFQIKPDAQQSANQAFIDASDSDPTSKPYLTIGDPLPALPGDFDGDGDADDQDYAIFEACATGPGILYNAASLPAGCTVKADASGKIPVDVDRDGDVDEVDFAGFQRCFSGRGVQVNPACAN